MDDRLVAAQIIRMLRSHLQCTPNERTGSALTSYRRNAIAPGIGEAVDVIAKAYKLEVHPDGVEFSFK